MLDLVYPLHSKSIITRSSDTPGLVKRHVSNLSLELKGTAPSKQTLRCRCYRQLRDDVVGYKSAAVSGRESAALSHRLAVPIEAPNKRRALHPVLLFLASVAASLR